MAYLRPLIPASAKDMESLNPRRALSRLVVSAYLRLVERRGVFYPTLPTVWAADGNFLQEYQRAGASGVRRDGGRDILDRDLLLFPLLLPSSEPHRWSLAVVRPERKEVTAYDPAGKPRAEEMATVVNFLQEEAQIEGVRFNPDEWVKRETPARTPVIQDNEAGGVFVLAFAELLSREATLEDRSISSTRARMTIATVLRRRRFDYEDFGLLGEVRLQRTTDPQAVSAVRYATHVAEGKQDLVEEQDDPLLQQLNQAIGDMSYARNIFPHSPTRPRSQLSLPAIPEEAEAPDADPLPEPPARPESPAVSLDCSDLEESEEAPRTSPTTTRESGSPEMPAWVREPGKSPLKRKVTSLRTGEAKGTSPLKKATLKVTFRAPSPTHPGEQGRTVSMEGGWRRTEGKGPRARARAVTGRQARSVTERQAWVVSERPAQTVTERPARMATERPARMATERAARRTTERPARRTREHPARGTTGRPARRISERPARRTREHPARGTTERPARRISERPARKTTEGPARSTTERPARRTPERPTRSGREAKRQNPRSESCRPWRSGDRVKVTPELLQKLERAELNGVRDPKRARDVRWRIPLVGGDRIRVRPRKLRELLEEQGT